MPAGDVDSPETPVETPPALNADPCTPIPSGEIVCPKIPYVNPFGAVEPPVNAEAPLATELFCTNNPSTSLPLQVWLKCVCAFAFVHTGSPPERLRTCPAAPAARRARVFAADPYKISPAE